MDYTGRLSGTNRDVGVTWVRENFMADEISHVPAHVYPRHSENETAVIAETVSAVFVAGPYCKSITIIGHCTPLHKHIMTLNDFC